MPVWQVTGPMKCRRERTSEVQEREVTVAVCAPTFEKAAAKAAKRPWGALGMKCEFRPDQGNQFEAVVVRQSGLFDGALGSWTRKRRRQ